MLIEMSNPWASIDQPMKYAHDLVMALDIGKKLVLAIIFFVP
jgi:hypothetical protein